MTVKLWAIAEGQLLRTLQDRRKVVALVRVSPDGTWFAAGSYGGRAMVWTLAGEPVVGIRASKKNLSRIAFSPDSTMLVAGGLGDDVSVWTLPSGEAVTTLKGHQTAVMSVAFLSQGGYLASLGYEQVVRFWNTTTWEETRALPVPGGTARGITFSPDESTAAVSMEGKVQLRSVADWSLQAELPVSVKAIYGTTFSPDGRWLAAGAADGKIRVWDAGG